MQQWLKRPNPGVGLRLQLNERSPGLGENVSPGGARRESRPGRLVYLAVFSPHKGQNFDKVVYLEFPSNAIPGAESVHRAANSVSLSRRVSRVSVWVCVSLFLPPPLSSSLMWLFPLLPLPWAPVASSYSEGTVPPSPSLQNMK